MGYAEKRGRRFRARWLGPSGMLESKSGFPTKTAAEDYANDRESEIRAGTYVDPRSGQITLTEWVNTWFEAIDAEPSTIADYQNRIEVRILPRFGERTLASLEGANEEIAIWERKMVKDGYAPSTAKASRTLLATILGDAVPRHIRSNPAIRRKGRGRKGQRRVEKLEREEKVWPTPLQLLLFAERCAALSGHDADFVLVIVKGYTGGRWSEINGLQPDCVHADRIDLHWKLYELNGRFYRGRPKDGSVRTVDCPPFLSELLTAHLEETGARRCRCHNVDPPWCPGCLPYVFLGPNGGHHRRSGYARRVVRPASDGRYPGTDSKPALRVLVDAALPPGRLLTPWPAAVPGELFTPPTGRGRLRIGDETPVATWLPLHPGLTPHGLRHGHQTWLEEARLPHVLVAERMGHELPGMRGIYTHVTDTMRKQLITVLQNLWHEALTTRAGLHPRSSVSVLDRLLAPYRRR